MALSPDPELRGFFHGTTACLSALFRAGRHEEILALVDQDPFLSGPTGSGAYVPWRRSAARTMRSRTPRRREGLNTSPIAIAAACEEVLRSAGRVEEAYRRYALEATRGTSYLATYRALARKYPDKGPEELLADLVATTPGDEGKWFATAKEVGLFDEAIRLANRTPCDPKTLTRAARDFVDRRPAFAVEAGLAALRWLVGGYGYEITGADVWAAYANTMKAAEKAGRGGEVREQIRGLVASETYGERFVSRVLGRELGL